VSALAAFSRELADLVARAAPAVVGVGDGRGHGSGLVLAGDGYVLTNAHVARAAGALRVRLADGGQREATLAGADEATDLAVLRVDTPLAPSLPLAAEAPLRVGELVVAIGNPLGFERSVTLGVVSALHRALPTGRGAGLEGLIQTDAAVNPGSSGGPLLDTQGRVVGITTAMVPWARGIGFAVPARTAGWITAVLIQKGEVRRPFLGITARGEEVTRAGAGPARGLRVLSVEAGTPAAVAGLRAHDLLLAANGVALLGVDDLQRAMVLSGEPRVWLDLDRGGEERRLAVEPRPRPRAA
jgi:S1-C subfamily serine protease